MNDSISVSSSSYSSSANNSNSNSLNRSLIANGSFSIMANPNNNNNNLLLNQARLGAVEDFLTLPMTPVRRRTRSQTLFFGDEISTVSEYNKQLIEDVYLLKKQLKEKDGTIAKLNDIRDNLENETRELSASLFEVI